MIIVAFGMLLTGAGLSFPPDEYVTTPEAFGAKGDAKANDWQPIKSALASCVAAEAQNRSCRVLFRSSYRTGPIVVNTSRTTLDVAPGATLSMLPRHQYCKVTPCKGAGTLPFISTAPGAAGCRTVTPPGGPGHFVSRWQCMVGGWSLGARIPAPLDGVCQCPATRY